MDERRLLLRPRRGQDNFNGLERGGERRGGWRGGGLCFPVRVPFALMSFYVLVSMNAEQRSGDAQGLSPGRENLMVCCAA